MSKRIVIISQIILLLWFFLDMVGVDIVGKTLVSTSCKDDLIYFIIYLVSVILFITKEKIGKYIVLIWLGIWFLVQFMSHELVMFYTVFSNDKTNYMEVYDNTIHLIDIDGIYIPDFYHIVLQILILLSFIFTIIYIFNLNKKARS